ncbi:glycoside hydrolase family 3 N-terminal domain-containing protein [Actinophytocola xinjiangensis]
MVAVLVLAAAPERTSGTAQPADRRPAPTTTTADAPPTTSLPAATTTTTAPTTTASACAGVIADLPPRRQLAQLLMVGVDPGRVEPAAELVRTVGVGGIFVGGNDTALLSGGGIDRVQAVSAVPLTVAVDEEGGRVQRIDELDGPIPSPRAMARDLTTDQVRDLARERGAALRGRGVTIDFAPVVDVSGQPDDSVIGDRSFGEDPATVTRYAGAFAQGLRDSDVLPVLKHFPGHGRASGDSHESTVVTPPLADLEAVDLVPYRELLGPDRPAAVLVGHVDVPGLTDGQPATLSPATYALLHDEFDFDGVSYTDDLAAMKAVTARYPLPEAVVTALGAGVDVAFWSSPAQINEVLDLLENAVATGRLPRQRVDEALDRVLRAKGLCG